LSNEQHPQPWLGEQSRTSENLIQGVLFLCGYITFLTSIAIIGGLVRDSLLLLTSEYIDESAAIHSIGVLDFVSSTEWQPHRYQVGIAPLATATLLSTFIAMVVALPFGLGSAIYLSEYASPKVRNTIKPIL